jgi:hypothetical protein
MYTKKITIRLVVLQNITKKNSSHPRVISQRTTKTTKKNRFFFHVIIEIKFYLNSEHFAVAFENDFLRWNIH